MAKINSYIIFDFETGGLDSNIAAITECAAIAITGDNFKELGRVNRLVTPYDKEYDPKALAHTGITIPLLEEDGVVLKQVAEEFKTLIETAQVNKEKNIKTILVGHNVLFDIGFLNHLFQDGLKMTVDQCNKFLEKHCDGAIDCYGHFQPRYIDTMTCSKQMWAMEEMKDWQLGTCISKAGIEFADAHRAMNDVEATKEMFIDFCLAMRSGKGGEAVTKKSRFRDYFRF